MATTQEADQLEKIRSIVRDALEKHMYSSAVFFADKLVAMSDRNPADVYLLAQAYLLSRQYRRALYLLRHENLLVENLRFKYLAAKCLEELKEWDECLQLLGEEDQPIMSEIGADRNGAEELAEESQEINIVAVLCLLRGRAYAALENCGKAVQWYKEALRADPFCYEAFQHLFSNQMLNNEEETQLLNELRFAPEDRWLRLLYECKANKFGQEDTLAAKLAELEGRDAAEAFEKQASGSQGRCWQEGVRPLEGNSDVRECQAEFELHLGEYERAYDTSRSVLHLDPYCLTVMPCHLAAALELGRKNEVFLQAHMLVDLYPKTALPWYAVGCYYFCIQQYDQARRYFSKATTLDASFAPAWIGFGNAYAAQDESDQAMAAYRAAARRFPGCHLASLSIGMEYQRANNFPLAKKFLSEACRMCSRDPLVHHELGVLAYRNNDFPSAVRYFKESLRLVPPTDMGHWEATWLNLGHALRRIGKSEAAIQSYEQAVAIQPRLAAGFASLGLTMQLKGETRMAIEFYHKALGIEPDDSLTTDLLKQALIDDHDLYMGEEDLED